MDSSHPVVHQVAQVVPAITLVSVHILGLGIPDWAALLGMVFVAVQLAHTVWKWRREAKRASAHTHSDY